MSLGGCRGLLRRNAPRNDRAGLLRGLLRRCASRNDREWMPRGLLRRHAPRNDGGVVTVNDKILQKNTKNLKNY